MGYKKKNKNKKTNNLSLITGKGSKKVVNYSRKFSIFYYPRYIFVFIQGKSQEESRVIETLNKIYNLIRIHFFSPFFFFRLPLFQNPSICFICAGERNLLPVCTECLCHASRASSVPGFSTAAAGLTSSNLLFCMSLCRGIPVLVSFVRKKKRFKSGGNSVRTRRFRRRTQIVTFPIEGTKMDALSLTSGPKF